MESAACITVVVADDDEDDRMLVAEALEECGLGGDLRCVEDGAELLEYLRQEGAYADPASAPRPGLVLLDLNMPRLNGHETLAQIKADPELRTIPIVMLTTSNADEDVGRSYSLGVSSYIVKPLTFDELVAAMVALTRYWFGVVSLPQARS